MAIKNNIMYKKIIQTILLVLITQLYLFTNVSYATDNVPCTKLSYYLRFGLNDLNTGGDVTKLQQFLAAYLHLSTTQQPIDGIFDTKTAENLKTFQTQKGIVPTGIAGVVTRNKITEQCSYVQTSNCLFNGQTILNGQSTTTYLQSSVLVGSCDSQLRTCNNGIMSGTYMNATCNTAVSQTNYCPKLNYYSKINFLDIYTGGEVTKLQRFLATHYSLNTTQQPINGVFSIETETNLKRFQSDKSLIPNGVLGVVSRNKITDQCNSQVAGSASCLFNGQTISNGSSLTLYRDSVVPLGQVCVSESRLCNNNILSGTFSNLSCVVSVQNPGSSCNITTQVPGVGTSTVNISSGTTRDFYLMSKVEPGKSCENIKQSRTCNDGIMSGEYSYKHNICNVAVSTSTEKTSLINFLPLLRSVSWYSYFNDDIGTDIEGRGLSLFSQEIGNIQNSNFNTVSLNKIVSWSEIQENTSTWNENKISTLKEYLKILQSRNMKAVLTLNSIGPGSTPSDVDSCLWITRPAEVSKFYNFAKKFIASLEEYNSGIYYVVNTDIPNQCIGVNTTQLSFEPNLASVQSMSGQVANLSKINLPFAVKNTINPVDGISHKPYSATNADVIQYRAYQDTQIKTLTAYIKASIGNLIYNIPSEISSKVAIGVQDSFVTEGDADDYVSENMINSQSKFDFFSISYYPTALENYNLPRESDFALNYTNARNNTLTQVTQQLDLRYNRFKNFYQTDINNSSLPFIFGEYGIYPYAPDHNHIGTARDYGPLEMLVPETQTINSQIVSMEAMKNWILNPAHKAGLNIWSWSDRYLLSPTMVATTTHSTLTPQTYFGDWINTGLSLTRVYASSTSPVEIVLKTNKLVDYIKSISW